MLLVIGLTGLASSGKGETSKYMVEEYGFTRLVFSDILRDEAEKRDLLEGKSYEEQKNILSKLGEMMRKVSGRWDILAVKLVEKINSGKFEKVIVDGFRSVEEVNLFRKSFEKFYLVFVEADEKIRFARRRLEDPNISLSDIRQRDKRDVDELGLGKVISMANFKINNDQQGLEHLHEKVDELMKKII